MKRMTSRCPTCKQDMAAPPRDGTSGRDCLQCGQGLSTMRAKRIGVTVKPRITLGPRD